jgi:hypothetical protein
VVTPRSFLKKISSTIYIYIKAFIDDLVLVVVSKLLLLNAIENIRVS